MSKVEVDQVTQQSGTTLTVGGGACKTAVVDATTVTLGRCGGTVSLASGATQSGFGRTGTVDWDTSIKTGTVTAVTGKGYFVNTTAGAITVNLPAAAVGSIVAVSDYASTAASNNITISPNGSEKINAVNDDYTISTAGLAVTLVYADATRGWKSVTGSDADATGIVPAYVVASGGSPCSGAIVCTNYKTHTFTGPGTFTVSCAGNPGGSDTVDYMIVGGGAGGSGAGDNGTGAGGGGGFRTSASTYAGPPLAVACGVTVTATGFPIAVGGGGAGGAPGACNPGTNGVSSSALSLTSAGGGYGSAYAVGGNSGGSGGGGGEGSATAAGVGNTPSVSPAQGFPGGAGSPAGRGTGGGGGATEAGVTGTPTASGRGGAGSPNAITGSAVFYAGGGGGGIYCGTTGAASPCGTGGAGKPIPASSSNPGTINRGGGGGGTGGQGAGINVAGGNGGSGIVIIRYKFQ